MYSYTNNLHKNCQLNHFFSNTKYHSDKHNTHLIFLIGNLYLKSLLYRLSLYKIIKILNFKHIFCDCQLDEKFIALQNMNNRSISIKVLFLEPPHI